jgi:hypothetical protein
VATWYISPVLGILCQRNLATLVGIKNFGLPHFHEESPCHWRQLHHFRGKFLWINSCAATMKLLEHKPVFNNMVFPQGWTLFPRGNVHPFVHPQGWTLSTVKKNVGGAKNFTPQVITSLLGGKIAPGGESLPLGAKLRMGLGTHKPLYVQYCKSVKRNP